MNQTKKINNIINEISLLDTIEQLNVLEKIISVIKDKKNIKKTSLTDLKGLGKEQWHKIDIDKYIEDQRKSWNDK